MRRHDEPFIPAKQQLPEITVKVVLLALCLTLVLAASNAYIALKMGLLTSASIPAAILSMGILRRFRDTNILQNNLVQTAASAGEAVAGGVVFTVPALILMNYWQNFPYWACAAIALVGGLLGVLFSIPLRRLLMTEPHLNFPEGKAVAEVLMIGEKNVLGLKDILLGGFFGATLQLSQTGLKIIASKMQYWFVAGRELLGFGVGFSPTMIGVGYLIGFNVSVSIFIGALIGWLICVPLLSNYYGLAAGASGNVTGLVMQLWDVKIRYIGIGAMLVAGLWTLLQLLKPFALSLSTSFKVFSRDKKPKESLLRTEKDMPLWGVLLGVVLLLVLLYGLFEYLFPLQQLGLASGWNEFILLGAVAYVLVIGFIFSAICGYFSGLVGVTATPGSSVIIAGLLFCALMLRVLLQLHHVGEGAHTQAYLSAAVTAIIIGSVITGAAAIANDNIQDLKVGHIVGATPWKQQLMLMLGVVVASLVIPPVMQLLFNVYGIGTHLPHPGMDPTQALAAPPAALMAALAQGIFKHNLPWSMIYVGAGIMVFAIMVNYCLSKKGYGFSALGVATGIYLPFSTTTPLFIGGLIAFLCQRSCGKASQSSEQRGILLACGMVVGASLMDVVLAIPFAMLHSPNALRIMPPSWNLVAELLAVLIMVGIGRWFFVVRKSS